MNVAHKQHHFRRIWLWPLLLAGTSLIGLISALLGDGVWDALSWIALGAPVAVLVVAAGRAQTER